MQMIPDPTGSGSKAQSISDPDLSMQMIPDPTGSGSNTPVEGIRNILLISVNSIELYPTQ